MRGWRDTPTAEANQAMSRVPTSAYAAARVGVMRLLDGTTFRLNAKEQLLRSRDVSREPPDTGSNADAVW
jgi:hypothetical protein